MFVDSRNSCTFVTKLQQFLEFTTMAERKIQIVLSIRCYFRNLWSALLGRNLFKEELERLRVEHKKNVEDVLALKEQYCNCVDKMDADGKLIISLQTLVENLRENLTDKNKLIDLVKKDYQERILKYNAEIDRLRTELRDLKASGQPV